MYSIIMGSRVRDLLVMVSQAEKCKRVRSSAASDVYKRRVLGVGAFCVLCAACCVLGVEGPGEHGGGRRR